MADYPYVHNYPYTYFQPSKKEQVALGIGSLLSGLMAASVGENAGNAALRGLAGTLAGYNQGHNQYQNYMGDAYNRYATDIEQQRRAKEDEAQLGYYDAMTRAMDAKSGMSPEDVEYEKRKRRHEQKMARYAEGTAKNKWLQSRKGETSQASPYTIPQGIDEDPITHEKYIVGYDTRKGEVVHSPMKLKGKELYPKQNPAVPASTLEDLAVNKNMLDFVKDIKTQYKPEYVGRIDQYQGNLGEWANAATNQQEKNFRASVANLTSGYFRTAGTQFTEHERAMLEPWMLRIKTGEGTFEANLENFLKYYTTVLKNRVDVLEAGKYRNVSNISKTLFPEGQTTPDKPIPEQIAPDQAIEMIKNLAINGTPEEKQKAVQYLKSKGM